MLKRITVYEVQLGMFIHELGGSWIGHPFWQTQFLLSSPEDLDRLRSSVREIWIDVEKGLDVPGGSDDAEVVAEAEAVLLSAA
jgi:hypothetical protein